MDDLIDAFSEAYGKPLCPLGTLAGAGLPDHERDRDRRERGRKPALPDEPESAGEPQPKGSRPVWWTDGWVDTPLYEQDDVKAGQSVPGPAVIESPADTFAVPPGRRARLDGHRIFHLEKSKEREGMAMVDRTRARAARGAADRLGQRTALEMLAESERLFADTGRYWGLDALPMRERSRSASRRSSRGCAAVS